MDADSDIMSSKSFGVPLKSMDNKTRKEDQQIMSLEQSNVFILKNLVLNSDNETVNSHITKMYNENSNF